MTTLADARALADRLDTPGPGFIAAAQAAQVIRDLIAMVEARDAAAAQAYAAVVRQGMAIYANEANDIQDRRAIRTFVDRFVPLAALEAAAAARSQAHGTQDKATQKDCPARKDGDNENHA